VHLFYTLVFSTNFVLKLSTSSKYKYSIWERHNVLCVLIFGKQIQVEEDIIIIIIKTIIVQTTKSTNRTREQTQAQKREPEGTVNQPANKVTRLNNINEDHFLVKTSQGNAFFKKSGQKN